jgi:hypothetical protein
VSILSEEYHKAVGNCLRAALALRRFDGKDAINELQSAINTITDAQREHERKSRRLMQPRAPQAPPVAISGDEW